ncbi:hypothetical protein [Phenylobacterium sp. J367]|uniref:hypothetical protein n=1 Tax=Phenylobacterium sp. J367 TaxID=2898435 RepID=UPI002150924D|nr:hypothetical protein [Phenylobacterium sp. J367]MCR5876932.1 hypothetical protein [Phenylobacterium sp. J367]MCR5877000.1 hypothetical protein [Phenylobacterium sp. J367]
MATSGSVDFTRTVRQIATAALILIGARALGEDPDAEEMDKALEQLNLMVKTWGADPAPKLWLKTEAAVTLVASTASYTSSPVTLMRKVLSARRRIGSGTSQNDLPLEIYSRDEYEELPNKLSTGSPLGAYFDPQRATRTLYVWPVPDATIAASTTLRVTYLRVIEDLDALENDFDLPQEWLEVLQYGLAARLALPFRMHLTDPTGYAEIKARAGDLYAQLSSWDEEEASVFLSPYH